VAKNRVVLTFSATPGGAFSSLAGWSETLWRNVDQDPDALLNAIVGTPATPPTIPYVYDRRTLLTVGWRIDGVKVYPITGGRISAAATFTGDTKKGLYPATDVPEDEQPYDRLLWKMNASAGHSRGCRIGGIPSVCVDPGGNYTGHPNFQSRFEDFITDLISAQFGLRYGTPGTVRQISNVTVDPMVVANASPRTPGVQLTGAFTAEFPAGRTVQITGSIDPARLNGQWTVQSVNAVGDFTNVVLKAKRSLQITDSFALGSYIRPILYDIAAMTSGVPVRGVSRKTGRPSGLPRGRRSNRR
jgi:hypothetical protein